MKELLCPVRNWASLKAVAPYADAVYFGVKEFNMRAFTDNFEVSELSKVVAFCKENNLKSYLTTNIIFFDDDLSSLKDVVTKAKAAGVDAVICHDLAAVQIAKSVGIPFHVSTQASASNIESVSFWKELGAERVVLARELSLDQIKSIAKNAALGIEVFIHGAMCVSVSGRCFFSHFASGKSANRGECTQLCRREWRVQESDGLELVTDGEHFLSAKDLCMIAHLPELFDTGAVSFKIEGRMKDVVYAETVARVYREAFDAVDDNTYSEEKIKVWTAELEKVFNRGFSTGFYFGKPGIEQSQLGKQSSVSTHTKKLIGKVINFYNEPGVAEVQLFADGEVSVGEDLIFESKSDFLRENIRSLEVKNKRVDDAKAIAVGVKVSKRVSSGMSVFKMVPR